MKKEIGGFFEFGDSFYNNSYHKNAIALNTATNALIYLIKAKKINKIYLPYYLCDCLNKIKEYCKVIYYRINEDFTPKFDRKLSEKEYIYIVNYFGMFDKHDILKYKKNYGNIIVDNVHAFFQMPNKSVDTIYSCRKFFGVSDGAYLYTNTHLDEFVPEDISNNRFKHLLGRLEGDASSYYEEYKKNENIIANLELSYMSKLTKVLMDATNYNEVKKRRTKNFNYVNKYLKSTNKIKLKKINGAYMYPYYIEDAEKIRNKLIENKVYIPVLWPNVLKWCEKDSFEYKFAKNILPIPIDQRYNRADMEYIIKLIIDFNEGR